MSRLLPCLALGWATWVLVSGLPARADLVVTTIDYPGASKTEPVGVSNNGLVAGFYIDGTTGATRGFERFADGSLSSPIIDPNDNLNFTRAFGVNNAGTVVGDYENFDGNVFTFHGFILSGG